MCCWRSQFGPVGIHQLGVFAVVLGAWQVGNRTRSSNNVAAPVIFARNWVERDTVSGIMRMIHRVPGATPNTVMVAPA